MNWESCVDLAERATTSTDQPKLLGISVKQKLTVLIKLLRIPNVIEIDTLVDNPPRHPTTGSGRHLNT